MRQKLHREIKLKTQNYSNSSAPTVPTTGDLFEQYCLKQSGDISIPVSKYSIWMSNKIPSDITVYSM